MPNQGVLVTYTAPPSFQASESWRRIREILLSQFPLRNVHWKPTSRPSLRTIRELDVILDALDTLRDELTSQVPVTVLEKPLLHVYIVTCEEFDLELYKGTIKRQIKEWLTGIMQRKNQEWLILHVVRPDSRMPTGNFFQLKGSVLDKIRTDFNVDKRDRCVQLLWSVNGNENSKPAAWADFITKMRDGILSALDSAIFQREEEVRRSESQQQMPGWNFCTFFILKESLASSFEGVCLFEDALQQYDELEACFYQVLKETSLSWFGTLISPSDGDDSAPLLSISKKPYRALILANTISVFDLRVYLIACQCTLLGKMGKLHEVCLKAASFLVTFGHRLREAQDLPVLFVESWIFSSALSVVEQSDEWAKDLTLEGVELSSFNAGKGELLERALDQLAEIGVKSGHLHPSFPTRSSPSSDSPYSPQTHVRSDVTHPELASALQDKEAFHNLCVKIANRAIEMFTRAGRQRSALKVQSMLAAIDAHCGGLSDAMESYTLLATQYAPGWPSLQSSVLSCAVDMHANLGKPKDLEWIRLVIAYLDTYSDSTARQLLSSRDKGAEHIRDLVNELKDAAQKLETNSVCPDHSSMSIEVSNIATIAEVQDGSYLEVTTTNHLPCNIPIEEISVVLTGRDAERLKFVSTTAPLQPGKTIVRLFCPTSSSGTYMHESSETRISRLLFQWKHQSSKIPARSPKKFPALVRVQRDPRAFSIGIRRSQLVELGAFPRLIVVISTGRNHITNAVIRLSGPVGLLFHYRDAVIQSADGTFLRNEDGYLKVVDVPSDQTILILVPHSDTSAIQTMKVTARVEYFTAAQSSVRRTMHAMCVVETALPIAVNVQDYFRGTRLFSKFTISATTHQHVRICSAQLGGPPSGVKGIDILGSSTKARVFTITPTQSANFLFQIDSRHGPVRESLSLTIKYRMLREEVEAVIKNSIEENIPSLPNLLKYSNSIVNELLEILESDASWVELYSITGELVVPAPEDNKDQSEHRECLHLVREKLKGGKQSHALNAEWHEIVIPVDVPRMTIVAGTRISLAPLNNSSEDVSPLYAGQPIPATLSIHTSFHWGTSAGDESRKILMQFDIEEMIRDWLVTGRKRGDFAAMDGATFSVPVTLIALHHGEISLPKVAVAAVPSVEGSSKGSMSLPSTETYQLHGAEKILVSPRGGRTTFVLSMEN